MPASVIVRRAADRGTTTTSWLTSRHSFSFGDYYDPSNTHHGLLMVNNEDTVAPAAGFGTHPHRDMEILTWVLEGVLAHRDSIGNEGVVYPGLAQRMSAGTGILHSERNDSAEHPVHFVQMWVVADEPGRAPGYQQADINEVIGGGGLVTIASGRPEHADQSAIIIGNRHAALHGARLHGGDSVELPQAPYLHAFVTRGEITLEGGVTLRAGDAARIVASGGRIAVSEGPAEILVWEMHAGLPAFG
jgi:redox-sensitive bicupin YhaK (pirin superfamily)